MEVYVRFGNQDRPQEVDDGHLVIDFRPLGVNFGLYRILQMICLENLIREFTNENLCISRGIWVNFLCLLFECLSKINPINESRIGHRESILGLLKSNFWFLGFDFEHLRGDFGHLGVAFESMGVGSWPLGVRFFGL